ncbi:MAG: GAF domain-containing protein, partial [Chloroflexaceae bacterium]|nr:GAF domain-containing protein [Chloroflexaceae bacterium]
MDATIASPPTHNWELLAQLALQSQRRPADEGVLVRQLAMLLQRHLGLPWGLLASGSVGQERPHAAWGLNDGVIARLLTDTGVKVEPNVLCLPLQVGPLEVGKLWLPTGKATAAEQFFLSALAAQLALLLQHYRQAPPVPSLPQPRRSPRRAEPASLEATLESVYEGVQALVQAPALRISLIDDTNGDLRLALQRGLKGRKGSRAGSMATWLAGQRLRLRLHDVQESPLFLASIGSDNQLVLAGDVPVRAYLGLPLLVGDELVGTLELASAEPGSFSAYDEQLLAVMTEQAALALYNGLRLGRATRQLDSRMEQVQALRRISNQLAITLYQSEMLAFVLEQACQATGATHAVVALRATPPDSSAYPSQAHIVHTYLPELSQDVVRAMEVRRSSGHGHTTTANEPEPQDYLIAETYGYSADDRDVLRASLVDGRMLSVERAIQGGEPIFASDPAADERAALRCPTARSLLAAPIWYQASVVGVVVLCGPQPAMFDSDSQEFARAIADQTAVAIGNSQRYEELEQVSKLLQRRVSMLKDVLEISQSLQAESNLSSVLEQIGYSVLESTDFRRLVFYLVEQEKPHDLRAVSGAGIPLEELKRIGQATMPAALARRYLEPRFQLGRSFFLPSEARTMLEFGLDTSAFFYAVQEDYHDGDAWLPQDRLMVPLYSTQGQLLGLMLVAEPREHRRPDRRSVEPLEIFANQAAIAVENYYLFAERERRIAE